MEIFGECESINWIIGIVVRWANYKLQIVESGADSNKENAKGLKIGGKFLEFFFGRFKIESTMDGDFCRIIGNDRTKMEFFKKSCIFYYLLLYKL
jgi:hypothetical protein